MGKHKKMSQSKREKERRRRREREKALRKLYKGVLCYPILITGVYLVFSGMLIAIAVLGVCQYPGAYPVFLPVGLFGCIVMPGFFITVRNPYRHPILFKLYFGGSYRFPWAAVNTDIIDLRRMYAKDKKRRK